MNVNVNRIAAEHVGMSCIDACGICMIQPLYRFLLKMAVNIIVQDTGLAYIV